MRPTPVKDWAVWVWCPERITVWENPLQLAPCAQRRQVLCASMGLRDRRLGTVHHLATSTSGMGVMHWREVHSGLLAS